MGQHRPLRKARRPARIDNRTGILPPGAVGDRVGRILPDQVQELINALLRRDLPVHAFLHEREKLLFRKGKVIVDVACHDGLDVRPPLQGQRPGKQQVKRDEMPRFGIGELAGELFFRIEGVVHDRHRAETVRRVVGDDELGQVGQEHGDPVALFDSQRGKGAGETVHQGVELPVDDPPSHVDETRMVGKRPGGPDEGLAHGDFLNVDFRRNPRCIGFVPHPLKCHGGTSSKIVEAGGTTGTKISFVGKRCLPKHSACAEGTVFSEKTRFAGRPVSTNPVPRIH